MKHIGLVIKLLILVGIIMAGVLFYSMCGGGSCVQRIDEMPPDITKAPWEVRTPTHLYYAEEARELPDGDVSMSGWYEQEKKKWVYHEDMVTLSKSIYGNISYRRR